MLGEGYARPKTDDNLCCFAHETIEGFTIADVHAKAFREISWHRNNTQNVTEDGEKVIEVGPRTYVVKNILAMRYVEALPYTQKFLNEYTNKMLNGYFECNNFEYDYHSRLYHYHHGKSDDIDQIAELQEKLIRNSNTRRAVAITWKPEIDNINKDVPCLQYIQCYIREDAFHMNVMFRSNDMLMAFGCNAYALTTLQRNICDYVGRSLNRKLKYGYYIHTVVCPHIYYERDAEEFRIMQNYCDVNQIW